MKFAGTVDAGVSLADPGLNIFGMNNAAATIIVNTGSMAPFVRYFILCSIVILMRVCNTAYSECFLVVILAELPRSFFVRSRLKIEECRFYFLSD